MIPSVDHPSDPAIGEDRLVSRRGSVVALIAILGAFLVTRLPFLDADIPEWSLTQYSPIDEFGYTVPAFNLQHFGTWVHQVAPWAPVEGLPMNVLENVGAAISMRFVGYDYWGLRASSLVFALVAFLCLIAIVRRQASEAHRLDRVPRWLALMVVGGAVVLLLADFSSLLSARIIEPTVTRLAAAALLVYLVDRGTFLGPGQRLPRTLGFGILVGAAVCFVYIYNLFLLPAAAVAVGWWAYRAGGRTALVRHGAAFGLGVLAAWVVYFVLIYGVYGQTPFEWYRVWIGSFGNSARASGISLAKALTVLEGNVFRLDPAFLGLFLVSLPVFAWQLRRRPTAGTVLIAAGLVCLVAQTAVVADYPARKGLMMVLFALPIAATGILQSGPFRDWLGRRRPRVVAAAIWLVVALALTLLTTPLRPVPSHGSILAMIVLASGVVGAIAVGVLATVRWRPIALAAIVAFSLAVLAPLTYADVAFVYRHPTFTYRDALIQVRPDIDGQQTAGGWSFGMQLYNTSRASVNAYFYGVSRAEYERDVLRMFTEGLATSMFDYVDDATRTHWESLGFRVVATYDILLPRGQILGRYVFAPSSDIVSVGGDLWQGGPGAA